MHLPVFSMQTGLLIWSLSDEASQARNGKFTAALDRYMAQYVDAGQLLDFWNSRFVLDKINESAKTTEPNPVFERELKFQPLFQRKVCLCQLFFSLCIGKTLSKNLL